MAPLPQETCSPVSGRVKDPQEGEGPTAGCSLHRARIALLPPGSLILCPLPLPELGRKFCFLTLSPILSRNKTLIELNLLSDESLEKKGRLG